MAWLDALRGIAAFLVVLEHSFDPILPELRRSVSPWFNLGKFGVLLFFLISGYVVPASLERRGDLRAFWIGRGFRLYPLFALAAAGALLLIPTGFSSLPAQLADAPGIATLAHLTMLNDLTGVPSLINVFWTLSYEMVFYLLITALYVFGLHRHSAGISLTCILVALAFGVVLTPAWLTSQASDLTVTGSAVGLTAGILLVVHGRQRAGAVVLGALALVLVALNNSRIGIWESLIILATMFAGTALYRIECGQLPRRALGMVALVPLLSIGSAIWFSAGWGMSAQETASYRWSWTFATVAAWLLFAAGWAMRRAAFPRWLCGMGLISYSLYLLHQIPLQILKKVMGGPDGLPLSTRLIWAGGLFAVAIALSTLTYRLVELPMQRLGRRLGSRTSRSSIR